MVELKFALSAGAVHLRGRLQIGASLLAALVYVGRHLFHH